MRKVMKFRRKPLVYEAIQWDGTIGGMMDVSRFAGVNSLKMSASGQLSINTLEGKHYASPQDWIVKGIKGEFWPVKPDIFAESYESAEEPDGNVHTMPLDDFQPHVESSQCWCQPVRMVTGPSGVEAWSHNKAKENVQ